MKIDWTKPLEVIDASGKVIEGATARYLGTLHANAMDCGYKLPHVLAIRLPRHLREEVYNASDSGITDDGLSEKRDRVCVRNVAETFERVVYANCYDSTCTVAYPTRKAADNGAMYGRIACIRVVVAGKVGQFDE